MHLIEAKIDNKRETATIYTMHFDLYFQRLIDDKTPNAYMFKIVQPAY